MFKPKHPLMKKILDKCVHNILTKYMGPVILKPNEELNITDDYDKMIELNDPNMERTITRRKAKVMWISGPDMMSYVIYKDTDKKFKEIPYGLVAKLAPRGYKSTTLYNDASRHYSLNNEDIYNNG